MSSPRRIQLKRTKGWRKPDGAVVVARPSKWGNIFRVGEPSPWGDHLPMTRAGAVEAYRYHIKSAGTALWAPEHRGLLAVVGWKANPEITRIARVELAGHDLCCWCPLDSPCHGDVLLEIANPAPSGTARTETRKAQQ